MPTSLSETPVAVSMAAYAAKLGVCPRYAHELARDPVDPLPTVKLGRRRVVPLALADAWLNRRATQPTK